MTASAPESDLRVPKTGHPSASKERTPLTEAEVRRVVYGFMESHELPDGYAFEYPDSGEWRSLVERFMEEGQKRLPAITCELDVEKDGKRLWLHMRGPEGTKEYLETIIRAASQRNPLRSGTRALRRGFESLTGGLRVLPDFLIIGAERCGTTSLYNYLSQHPSVIPAVRKDIHFFNLNHRLGAGWYRSHFPTLLRKHYHAAREGRFATGDSTPSYCFSPHAPRRVFELLPRVKLLLLLRDPVERAYSHYHMALRDGYETLSFEEALEREDERLKGELERMLEDESYYSSPRHLYSYLARGNYADQLKPWLDRFPREQLLVLKSEDLYENPPRIVKRVQQFLSLPLVELTEHRKHNQAPYPAMDPALRKRLVAHFEAPNARLFEMLRDVDEGWTREPWS
jgi:hypothetical protein